MIRRLFSKRAELDEAAFALPVLLLVSLALVNLALLGFAAVNASNAAEYGARMGSVAQSSQASAAAQHASAKVSAVQVGSYSVSVSGGGAPGSRIEVRVTYRVPNYFGGLARLFGVSLPGQFQGTARAYFRQEGW
jgi:predicted MFS family arabinose efflux permease